MVRTKPFPLVFFWCSSFFRVCHLFRVLIAYGLVCRSIEVVTSRIALIGLEPIGGRTHGRQQDLEQNGYEYTEDLRVDRSTGAMCHPTS